MSQEMEDMGGGDLPVIIHLTEVDPNQLCCPHQLMARV
jgi:hypothetical protein